MMPAIINFLGYIPIDHPNTLPELLVSYRAIHGFSQHRAATTIGVDTSTWQSWETATSEPRSHRVKALIEAHVLPVRDRIEKFLESG